MICGCGTRTRPRSSQKSSGQYGATTSLGGRGLLRIWTRLISSLRTMRGLETISVVGSRGPGSGVDEVCFVTDGSFRDRSWAAQEGIWGRVLDVDGLFGELELSIAALLLSELKDTRR